MQLIFRNFHRLDQNVINNWEEKRIQSYETVGMISKKLKKFIFSNFNTPRIHTWSKSFFFIFSLSKSLKQFKRKKISFPFNLFVSSHNLCFFIYLVVAWKKFQKPQKIKLFFDVRKKLKQRIKLLFIYSLNQFELR